MKGHLCTWGEQCTSFTAWHRTMKRRVKAYDNGGTTWDRYTVVILRRHHNITQYDIYGMSENALSPQGFNQYSNTVQRRDALPLLGKRVNVQDLPHEVISAIEQRL